MRSGRFLAPFVILLASSLVSVQAAAAGPGDGIGGDGTPVGLMEPYIEDGELKTEIIGEDGVVPVIGGRLPDWMRRCRWEVMTLMEVDRYFSQFYGGGDGTREEYIEVGLDPDARWNVVFCAPTAEAKGISPEIILTGVLEVFEVGAVPPQIILDWIVARAIAEVPIPVQVGQSAPFGDAVAPMIAQLPAHLWVDETVWQPVSATPPPVFGTTATATATPYRVEFFGPDGEWVDCGNNTGPAYDFSLPDEAQSSVCTITYRHSSSVGEFELVSKIYWEITWACTAFCGTGTLDAPFTTTRTRTVRVAELQAIGTSIGSD